MDRPSIRALGVIAAVALLTGCGTMSGVGYAGFGTRVASLDTDGDGGKIRSHFSNHSGATVRGLATAHCNARGKDLSIFKLDCSGGLMSFSGCGEFYHYSFRCALAAPPSPPGSKSSAAQGHHNPRSFGANEIEAMKKKCSELGLKVGSEKFGECVLRLTK